MKSFEMTPTRCRVILALAECDMSANAASKKLFMDSSTVVYHIRRIKAITGKDPRKFFDLVDLVAMVKGEREWTITDIVLEHSETLSPWAEKAIKGDTVWTV